MSRAKRSLFISNYINKRNSSYTRYISKVISNALIKIIGKFQAHQCTMHDGNSQLVDESIDFAI